MIVALQIHDGGAWVLSTEQRITLFSELYVPMLREYNSNTWEVLHQVTVNSRLELIRQLQYFFLFSSSMNSKESDVSSCNTVPNLQYFIDDAIQLLRILKQPVATFSTSLEQAHPFYQFNIQRNASWNQRYKSLPNSVDLWKEYMCGLCDALFGLWPASGPGPFHKEHGASGCIGTLLTSFIHGHRDASGVPHIDCYRFDAAYIESRGPFRFKAASSIDDHLLITEHNEILFYAHWQKWACLTSLSVLHSKSLPCTFDILMCSNRRGWKPQPLTCQIRTSLSQIFGDLVTTGMLFFLQDDINKRIDIKNQSSQNWWIKRLRTTFSSFPATGRSSARIAKRIGMSTSDDDLSYARAFLECCNNDWARLVNGNTLFRTLSPFKDRVDNLHDVLKRWKPKTVWEMHYPGYGGVDPVGLYAFYFAAVLGIVTLISLGVTIAQTFAAFKALDLNVVAN